MSNNLARTTYRVTDYRHNRGNGKLIYARNMEDAAIAFASQVYGYGGYTTITRRPGKGTYRLNRADRPPITLTITRA